MTQHRRISVLVPILFLALAISPFSSCASADESADEAWAREETARLLEHCRSGPLARYLATFERLEREYLRRTRAIGEAGVQAWAARDQDAPPEHASRFLDAARELWPLVANDGLPGHDQFALCGVPLDQTHTALRQKSILPARAAFKLWRTCVARLYAGAPPPFTRSLDACLAPRIEPGP